MRLISNCGSKESVVVLLAVCCWTVCMDNVVAFVPNHFQQQHNQQHTQQHNHGSRMSSSSSGSEDVIVSQKKGGILRRVRDSVLSKERSREDLKIGIAGFYDRSSKLWEDVWGEHMHHGYYVPETRTDHQQAQIDMIDKVLEWSHVADDEDDATNNNKPKSMVDVGCGIGGSSRHIARKYGCTTQGLTLSPYQANRANELAKEQGLQDSCQFQVADALDMPFENDSFDLVWSLESGEHMPDKEQFISELFRVACPGGRIIIVTWCHRDFNEGETSLTKKETKLLAKINRAYYLPPWCSVADYVNVLKHQHNAVDIQREDWSYIIAPFWKAVIQSSLNLKSIWGLLKSGFQTQRGAYAMFLMLKGFHNGLIKFGLITCTKPIATSSPSSSPTTNDDDNDSE